MFAFAITSVYRLPEAELSRQPVGIESSSTCGQARQQSLWLVNCNATTLLARADLQASRHLHQKIPYYVLYGTVATQLVSTTSSKHDQRDLFCTAGADMLLTACLRCKGGLVLHHENIAKA